MPLPSEVAPGVGAADASGAQCWRAASGKPAGSAADPKLVVTGLLEAVPLPLGLSDTAGHLRWANAALRELLDGAAEAESLRRAISELARAVTAVPLLPAAARNAAGPAPDAAEPRGASTFVDGWQIHVTRVPAAAAEPLGCRGVVCVERGTMTPARLVAVRSRYGLTRREAQVTALLGLGRSCASIAATLSISRHTARRHTESVLRKLDVHSRAEIVVRLLGGPAAGALAAAADR